MYLLLQKRWEKIHVLFVSALIIVLYIACNNQQSEPTEKPGLVTVTSTDMNFELPDTIGSGWTTFLYNNESTDTHFFVIEKYPEGKTLDTAKNAVISVFDEAMDSIMAGNTNGGLAVFANLPAWYGDVRMLGGAGLTAPGSISQTTMKLEPGYYLMECYVKMPNGKFHSAMGMITDFVVTSEDGGGTEPQPTEHIEISSNGGIVPPDTLGAGEHVFAVHYKDQKPHENFVGHDVQLVRLADSVDINKLEAWMNWINPNGMMSPTPDGLTFLGGTQEMPGETTGYFSAELTPGNYAFVSEVPEALQKNMLKVFTVPAVNAAD